MNEIVGGNGEEEEIVFLGEEIERVIEMEGKNKEAYCCLDDNVINEETAVDL